MDTELKHRKVAVTRKHVRPTENAQPVQVKFLILASVLVSMELLMSAIL